MVSLASLLIPIVVSALVVFILSFILHMVLPYHRTDYDRVSDADEDRVLDFVRALNLPPGDYFVPMGTPGRMKDPAFMEKAKRGPMLIMNVGPGWTGSMAGQLAKWFVFCLVVSLFGGYLASRFIQPGADYLQVFRLVGTATFMGYGLALAQFSIWYRRKWSTTLKSMFDALLYGLFTAGVFGWLWPS